MSVEIKLNLPDSLVESVKHLGEATQEDISTVLLNILEVLLPTLETLVDNNFSPVIANLADTQVVALADAKMDRVSHQRLRELQQTGKTTELTPAERDELLTLISIYQLGQLRKSAALAEAVKRGLLSPLHS
jgi:predicted RecB family endonuclease